MKTSANGVAFIKAQEGYTPKPQDDNGHLMWGYGHDRRGYELVPDYISLGDSGLLLISDLEAYFEPVVNHLAPWANQNQFDALIDFCYNEGPGALATMLHHGQSQVPTQMAAWCYEHVNGILTKSNGLAIRRAREIALYNS